tara:strand:+ start:43 stop:432 length:390 start_codon:yes stop_codon:yes gene_type:complete
MFFLKYIPIVPTGTGIKKAVLVLNLVIVFVPSIYSKKPITGDLPWGFSFVRNKSPIFMVDIARTWSGSRFFNWHELFINMPTRIASKNLNRENCLFSSRRYKRGNLAEEKSRMKCYGPALITLNLVRLV